MNVIFPVTLLILTLVFFIADKLFGGNEFKKEKNRVYLFLIITSLIAIMNRNNYSYALSILNIVINIITIILITIYFKARYTYRKKIR